LPNLKVILKSDRPCVGASPRDGESNVAHICAAGAGQVYTTPHAVTPIAQTHLGGSAWSGHDFQLAGKK